jgi:hypothetical protein
MVWVRAIEYPKRYKTRGIWSGEFHGGKHTNRAHRQNIGGCSVSWPGGHIATAAFTGYQLMQGRMQSVRLQVAALSVIVRGAACSTFRADDLF